MITDYMKSNYKLECITKQGRKEKVKNNPWVIASLALLLIAGISSLGWFIGVALA